MSQESIITYDIYNDFGNDLELNGSEDLQISGLLIKSQQRVLRRLFTNPGDYIWHPNYGAGLNQYIGQSLSSDRYSEIRSRILSNIFLEDSVSKNPVPIINLSPVEGGLFCEIIYTEQSAQQIVVLSFNINNNAFTT